jgi:hypothetical protein
MDALKVMTHLSSLCQNALDRSIAHVAIEARSSARTLCPLARKLRQVSHDGLHLPQLAQDIVAVDEFLHQLCSVRDLDAISLGDPNAIS